MSEATTIPDWVTTGAAVVVVRNSRVQTATRHTILRVGKRYAVLDDGTRFDATKRGYTGSLTRSRGQSGWEPSENLFPEGHDTARSVLVKQAIGDAGRRLTVLVDAFVKDPTEARAVRARQLITEVRGLVAQEGA